MFTESYSKRSSVDFKIWSHQKNLKNIDSSGIYESLTKDDVSFYPGEKEKTFGFYNVNKDNERNIVTGNFREENFYLTFVSQENLENKSVELKKIEDCGFVITEDFLLLYGSSFAKKGALSSIAKAMNVPISSFVFDKEEMKEIYGSADLILNINFSECPHGEIKTLKISGEIEDAYGFTTFDLDHSLIKDFTGKFGINKIKVKNIGSFTLYKNRGKQISIEDILIYLNKFTRRI